MKKRSWAIGAVSVIAVVLTVSAALAGRVQPTTKPAASQEAPKVAVRVAAVERHPLRHPIHAAGLLRAKSQTDLSFLVGGQVRWIGVDVGSKVRRGQVLARLDETQVAADSERASAAAAQAQRDLERTARLQEAGALPSTTLENARTGQAMATAQQRAAEFALQHAALVAPEDGVIDARLVERRQAVGPGQPAFRMSGSNRGAVVRVGLGERDVVGLELGRRARVELDALEQVLPARVSQIPPAASTGSGTFEVEVRLDSPPREYKSGMTAKVEIERLAQVGSIVPVSALVPGERDGAQVVAIAGGVARRLPVHVLFLEGEQAALKEPLTGTAEVATLGAGMLGDGAAALVVQP